MNLSKAYGMAGHHARSRSIRTALAFLFFPMSVPCVSAELPVVEPPDSVILLGPGPEFEIVDTPEALGQAPWRVAQWNAPHPLERIDRACLAGRRSYRSRSPSISFVVRTHAPCQSTELEDAAAAPAGDDASFEVTQQGTGLRCEMNGIPFEFDAFFAPQPSAISKVALTRPIDATRRLRHRITLIVDESHQGASGDCKVNQNHAITSVVFTNRRRRQTLFYQLTLHQDGLREAGPFWWATGKSGMGGWASTKGEERYGFQDRLEKFGLREPERGERLQLDIDLLGRIRQIISEGGKYGMDQDLSDWFLTGAYFGQGLWGRGNLSTRWTGYRLEVTLAE
jgi:hypothetical protein